VIITEKLAPIIHWCRTDGRVKELLLVGSYAREEQRPDSDIDLVLISDNKESLLELDWIELYGRTSQVSREEYGACTSIRVFYEDGSEIEYGIVDMSWLSLPLDPGTERVLYDGHVVLFKDSGL